MKQQVYVVTAVVEEEFWIDDLSELEEAKQQIRETFRDYKISDIRVSDKPQEREFIL